MAVLIVATVENQSRELYDGMLAVLEPLLLAAPGFIAHGAGPSAAGWQTFEIWATPGDATRFFATHIHPLLPPGVRPKRTLVDLHSLIIAEAGSTGQDQAAVVARLGRSE